MKFRAVGAAAVALTAALLLSGCGGSNVGVAAKFGGQQISQTQLSNYVTPAAKGIQLSSSSTTLTPPKAFVLFVVINEHLYADVLRTTKGGAPSPGTVAGLIDKQVGNGTLQQAVGQLAVKGYTDAFARQVLRLRALGQLLGHRSSSGVDVRGTLAKLAHQVTVNPRYGEWDPKTMTVQTEGTAGLPDFLTLQPGSSTTG